MTLEEQIRHEVRNQIKEKITTGNQETRIDENAVGDAIRSFATVAGSGGIAASLAAGTFGLGTAKSTSISVFAFLVDVATAPFSLGLLSASVIAVAMKILYNAANKVDDESFLKKVNTLGYLTNERDKLIAMYNEEEMDPMEKDRIEKQTKKMTRQMRSLANDIDDEIRDNPKLKEEISQRDMQKVKAVLGSAQEGVLTTLDVKNR